MAADAPAWQKSLKLYVLHSPLCQIQTRAAQETLTTTCGGPIASSCFDRQQGIRADRGIAGHDARGEVDADPRCGGGIGVVNRPVEAATTVDHVIACAAGEILGRCRGIVASEQQVIKARPGNRIHARESVTADAGEVSGRSSLDIDRHTCQRE